MKKSSLLTRLLPLACATAIAFSSCKKENSDSLTPAQEEEMATASNESQTQSEFVFNDVFDNVMGVNTEVGVGGTGVFGRMASGAEGREMSPDSAARCFIVTVVRLNAPALFPVRITTDFGAGCTGPDGHTRSGKIITEYTGRLIEPGSSATTHFENFKIDSISVQGNHKITNTTATTAGANQRQFTITVRDAKLTTPSGNYTEWRSDRVNTQIEGNGSVLPTDDIFRITGSAQGRVKHGNLVVGWQSAIEEPLIKKFTCRWISKGVIKTRRETLSSTSPWVAVLNFGGGDCDFLATLTINGVTHSIQLPH